MRALQQLVSLAAIATAATFAASPATAALTFVSKVDLSASGKVTAVVKAERDTFEARFDPLTITRESFSGYSTGSTTSLSSLFPGLTGAGSLTVESGQGFVDSDLTNPNSGRFDTSCPTPIPNVSDGCVRRWFEASGRFDIHFGTASSGFGFYATDVGDFSGTLAVSLLNDSGSTTPEEFTFADSGNGALAFIGAFDDTNLYTGARITIIQSNPQVRIDFFGFDDLVIGLAPDNGGNVPEPTTLALTGLGLLGLAAARRRRAG